ncbi:DUF6328 family protein [Kutzneria viridogrisea]|uniref:Uncharacterized protein n=2 Tax=Kutzneria TaxID=43356 RepID=W5WLV5_9PSEU|nr:DUF6328 family protein [Kutzneria albida]AHI01853.1 hypothetical protein KALB_8496 [Kutzneria albida DSM 43870]MBA8929725.1 hypothetical protein [Kutzneria viridogrisea]
MIEESEQQRLARNLSELLQELRVAQNGVQVLFGFLLALTFTELYARADSFVHLVHMTTVLLSGGAVGFLIAPAAWHRLLFRHGKRELIIRLASRFAVTGLALLAGSMTGTVLMIGYVVFGGLVGGLLSGAVGLFFLLLWFVIPLLVRIS